MANAEVVVVTGAAGGIGMSVVERLIADGYKVAALDINEKQLDVLRGQCDAGVTTFRVDQTNEAAVRDVIDRVEKELGPIEAFANVTGWVSATRFEQEDSAYWRKVIAINFEALLYTAHPILVRMIERKRGRMVFVASDAGRVGTSTEAVYAATKAGVIALAKSLARENARHNIRVNCVSPGPTETPLFAQAMKEDPETLKRMVRIVPFRRLGKPSEQAAALSFLLSEDASYITGQTLSVSGGLTMA
ncbi:MAG: SDR family NAD(P)-dependent oxidoreductase [Pseudorhodoplanes sp.]